MSSDDTQAREQRDPTHISYSSRSTYELCPKQYQLTRLIKVPETPAWWNVGGSAVHASLEAYDLMPTLKGVAGFDVALSWRTSFTEQISEAVEREPDSSKWRMSTGKNPPRNEEEWNEWGPVFIQRYVDWRERAPWTVWITPDGEPAIELDVSGKQPGCDLEVKGFIDRVFHDPITDSLWILDLKSGSKDASTEQLGTYRALLERKFGVKADHGLTFNVRRGTPSSVKDLSEWTPEYAGVQYAETAAKIKAGEFPAKPADFRCRMMCGVRHACAAVGGAEARRYDPDHAPF